MCDLPTAVAMGTRTVVIMCFWQLFGNNCCHSETFLYFILLVILSVLYIQSLCIYINKIVSICSLQRELGLISFQQYLAVSVDMATLYSVSLT